MERDKITFLDGSKEQQEKAVKDFLDAIPPDEHEMAMLNEFDYLDVD